MGRLKGLPSTLKACLFIVVMKFKFGDFSLNMIRDAIVIGLDYFLKCFGGFHFKHNHGG